MFILAFVCLLLVGISIQQFGRHHHHQPLRQGKMTEWVNVDTIIMIIVLIIVIITIVFDEKYDENSYW